MDSSKSNLTARVKLKISNKLKEYANKMGRDHLGGDDIPSNKKSGGLRDNDGYDNVQYNRDMPQDEQGVGTATVFLKNQEELDESVNEGRLSSKDAKKLSIGSKIKTKKHTYTIKGFGNKANAFRQFEVENEKGDSFNIQVSLYGTTDIGVAKGRSLVFRDTEMLESVNEPTLFYEFLLEGGLPQNWMAGRVSDYHTKLRGKKRDYDDTNFAKMNTGQPDMEDEELDPDNEVVNEKFDKVEHLSLLTKALKSMPGSQSQKEIIRQLNVVRKAGGMRPLKETAIEEYASRLTNAYILDDESVLDGTPEEKDAINKESATKKSEKNYKDWKSTNEESERDYKDEYKKFQSSTKSKKYRAELNKYNRDKGTYGNGDGKDASHKGGKIVGFESASKNRGRAEKSRLKKKK